MEFENLCSSAMAKNVLRRLFASSKDIIERLNILNDTIKTKKCCKTWQLNEICFLELKSTLFQVA
jgi:hypothetical protein